VRFFIDNNLSPKLAQALHCLVRPDHEVIHLRERFPQDAHDADWMRTLAQEKGWVIISADTAISRNPHEVEAWKQAGHPIFFVKHSLLQQGFWLLASRLCKLFPDIIRLAERARPGDSFQISATGRIQ
jgi:PIN like domain